MCTVCGCGDTENSRRPGRLSHPHSHDHTHDHSHDHTHDHTPGQTHHYGQTESGLTVAGFSQERLIQIEQNILSKNDGYAASNRQWLAAHDLTALNLLSSPGAGKTTLLVETIRELGKRLPVGVIEGDQETSNDADRILQSGASAIQINTGKGCHLDAHMIGHALGELDVTTGGVVFVENVGNLVCPAMFDLGEHARVVILSVTEGDDKPIKYPDMFAAADLLLISKTDLLPYVDFSVAQAIEYASRVNPDVETLEVSAKQGVGMTSWIDWIMDQCTQTQPGRHTSRR